MRDQKLRFITLLTALLIFSFLFISLVSYFNAHKSISTQIKENTLPLTSDNIYSEIQRDLLKPILISSMMAKDTFVRDWIINGEDSQEDIIHYLQEIKKSYGAITSFFISEKTRIYYHPSGVLKKVDQSDVQDKWYFLSRDLPSSYEINVDIDTADKSSLTIFINHKVFDYTGEYIGIIGVGLSVDSTQTLIESYKQRYGRQVFFVDREGDVVLHGSSYNGVNNIKKAEGLSTSARKILSSRKSTVAFKTNNKNTYLDSRFIPEFNWHLIVTQQENEAELKIQNILISNLTFSLIASIVIIFLVNIIISSYQKKLETLATTDKLTGTSNRQIFDALFKQAHGHSKRNKLQLSAIMIDVDYFKKINDSHGHPAGDKVLQALAEVLKNSIRESDSLFRWGGEEFLILLPDSNVKTARRFAEKIRLKVAEMIFTLPPQSLPVTVSAGVASIGDTDTADDLISRADKALYSAKENGRNRVEQA
ncbi:diguanylate cyclase [Gammaproteobacteria bacterium 54_18_T64]|nr:diguanylate cyclase [Gammaproteobacteria bacterium 54_18_T64]